MRFSALLLVLSFTPLVAQQKSDNYLLVDSAGIEAARKKAENDPAAKSALNRLIADAERALKQPVELPDRGGQWPHWYSCKRDGARLQTVSPVKHRCPVCGAEYSGEPYDSVVLYGVHSRYAAAIRDCGLAYRFTGRAEFAKRAGEILTAYADRYGTYKLHNTAGDPKVGGGHIMAQTLDESVWLIPAAWGYALVRDTLAEAARGHIEKDLFVAAANVIREHRMGIHNIQCWKNSAVALAGYVSGDRELVREAIEDPERGFKVQIEKGVTADGLWYEGSLGYHAYTMQALWPLTEAARNAGLDLYSARYRTLWDAPLALAFPNGDPPGFNDNNGGNVVGLAPLYELAYARWRKAEYGHLAARSKRDSLQALLYGAETLATGALIPESSVLLKDAGFAMLRGGTTAAAVRFGMHGGGHGHPDKLNLVTFGAGAHLGLDPGSINYGVPLHKEWYRSTVAHDTVSVDLQVQGAKDGKLEDWQVRDGITKLVASANDVYPGVQLRRTVTVDRKGAIEDRFECAAEGEHIYDWAFHAAGRLTSSLTFAPRKEPPGDKNGYQHIKDVAAAETSEPFWVRWQTGGATLTLEFKAAPGTEVIKGVAPGKNPADKIPMILVRRKAAKTVFEVTHVIR